jgi:hypothetical protein
MSGSLVERPAEPVDTDVDYGGFAEIARRINALHPDRRNPISRQLVAKWYSCREHNGFPERVLVTMSDGRVKELFDLAAVDRWHTIWRLTRTPVRPPIETIPLFQMEPARRHPADAEQGAVRTRPEARGDYRSSVLDL